MPAVRLDESVITLAQPSSPAAEDFRRLRTNVQFADIDRPLRTLSLVAPQTATGKSTIAANLAVAFAQGGKQVILVDADLLNPAQHLIFRLPGTPGFVDVLNGDAALDAALLDTAAPGVRLLPCGSASENPAQTLNSPRLDTVLTRLLEFADLVIFDTPALAGLADAALFAARMDGVLLVADSGESRRSDMRSARDLLERVHAHVLGVSLNHAHEQRGWLGALFRPA